MIATYIAIGIAKDVCRDGWRRCNAAGSVSSGQTYMVGERGPELFVPGRSGTIVANDKMGGGSTNVVVNVDAKGSSVEGNEQGANQLGRVISAAVQSELIKQQRPGGILAR
jgi:phage-related minor tail protein